MVDRRQQMYTHAPALADGHSSGYYNENWFFRNTVDGDVVLRYPKRHTPRLDEMVWPEDAALDAVAPYVAVPRVIYSSMHPRFFIQEYVPGPSLSDEVGWRQPAPDWVLDQAVETLFDLARVPLSRLPVPAHGMPGGTRAAARRYLAGKQRLVYRNRAELDDFYDAVGLPTNDLIGAARSLTDQLGSRPIVATHSDLSFDNLRVDRAQGQLVVLDWETAGPGDAVRELARHLENYPAEQHSEILDRWRKRMPSVFTAGAEQDLPRIRAMEALVRVAVGPAEYWARATHPSVAEQEPDEALRFGAAFLIWEACAAAGEALELAQPVEFDQVHAALAAIRPATVRGLPSPRPRLRPEASNRRTGRMQIS